MHLLISWKIHLFLAYITSYRLFGCFGFFLPYDTFLCTCPDLCKACQKKKRSWSKVSGIRYYKDADNADTQKQANLLGFEKKRNIWREYQNLKTKWKISWKITKCRSAECRDFREKKIPLRQQTKIKNFPFRDCNDLRSVCESVRKCPPPRIPLFSLYLWRMRDCPPFRFFGNKFQVCTALALSDLWRMWSVMYVWYLYSSICILVSECASYWSLVSGTSQKMLCYGFLQAVEPVKFLWVYLCIAEMLAVLEIFLGVRVRSAGSSNSVLGNYKFMKKLKGEF